MIDFRSELIQSTEVGAQSPAYAKKTQIELQLLPLFPKVLVTVCLYYLLQSRSYMLRPLSSLPTTVQNPVFASLLLRSLDRSPSPSTIIPPTRTVHLRLSTIASREAVQISLICFNVHSCTSRLIEKTQRFRVDIDARGLWKFYWR